MQFHTLIRPHGKKRSRRIGRGGKRGSYSGRGVKGQRSRAGHRIRPAERDLLIRLPKRRGFSNRPKSSKPVAISLERLAAVFGKLGAKFPLAINRETLRGAGLVRKTYRGGVKILGGGPVKEQFLLEGLRVSKGARTAIEKAGGSVK